jgi:peptidoglycan/LPS O-acetylase OafA/YrhL
MKERFRNLDALRGFLALCVVIYHIPKISKGLNIPYFSDLPIFHKADDAVLTFFCLSGFLIIGLLYDEKKKFGKINIKNFYLRRILRLYPVYYLVLFFGFFYYRLLLPYFNIPYELNATLFEAAFFNFFFLPNIFVQLYDPGSILAILWSIGIEEQFYLFIAPILFLIPINKHLKYLIVFTTIYFIAFHLPVFEFLPNFRFYYFYMSAGGVLAIASRKKLNYFYISNTILRYSLYAVYILHYFTNIFEFDNLVISDLFKFILFNFIVLNLAYDRKINIKNVIVNYIGKISYGIYMYHMIIVNLVLFIALKFKFANQFGYTFTIIMINILSILGTILFSHLSFKYIEKYFIKLKSKFRK